MIPNGMTGDTLYDLAFDGQQVGVSHIPITMNNLGTLSNFKMIKASFNANKKVLKIFYQFTVSSANDRVGSEDKETLRKGHRSGFYFEEMQDDDDDRSLYAKELMTLIGTELGVSSIGPQQRDELFDKVHDVLNQFQNICYTKGFKA